MSTPPEQMGKLTRVLTEFGRQYELRIIFSTHPRTKSGWSRLVLNCREVELLKPLDSAIMSIYRSMQSRFPTVEPLRRIPRFWELPALNMREAHERPEGHGGGFRNDDGLEGRVAEGLSILETQGRDARRIAASPIDYTVPNVSEKVLRIVPELHRLINRGCVAAVLDAHPYLDAVVLGLNPLPSCRRWQRSLQQLGHEVIVLTGFPNFPSGRLYPGTRCDCGRGKSTTGFRSSACLYSRSKHVRKRALISCVFRFCRLFVCGYRARPDVVTLSVTSDRGTSGDSAVLLVAHPASQGISRICGQNSEIHGNCCQTSVCFA